MPRTVTLMVTLGLGMSLLAAGCGKDAETKTKPPTKAKTPKEAVVNFAKAFENGDKDLFMSSVYVSDEDRPIAEAIFDMTHCMRSFSKEFEEAYGKDAAGMMRGPNTQGFPSPREVEEKIEIEAEGDTATAIMPGKPEPMSLVKKGDRWMIDMSEKLPEGEERNQLLKTSKAMVGAINEVRGKIGKEGYDAEKINMEFIQAMMKVAMEAGMQE